MRESDSLRSAAETMLNILKSQAQEFVTDADDYNKLLELQSKDASRLKHDFEKLVDAFASQRVVDMQVRPPNMESLSISKRNHFELCMLESKLEFKKELNPDLLELKTRINNILTQCKKCTKFEDVVVLSIIKAVMDKFPPEWFLVKLKLEAPLFLKKDVTHVITDINKRKASELYEERLSSYIKNKTAELSRTFKSAKEMVCEKLKRVQTNSQAVHSRLEVIYNLN